MKRVKQAALVSAIISMGVLTGCATTGDLDALQAEVARVSETANRAAADAASAKADAAAARSAAEQASASAAETNEKLDRMFEKSMRK